MDIEKLSEHGVEIVLFKKTILNYKRSKND